MLSEIGDRRAGDARRLMAQSHYELNKKGDRLQASEKASGAVAHAVKAIAFDRQWRNGSHNLRRQIGDLLALEFDRPELPDVQYAADRLHDNFYEDLLHDWQIRERLNRVTGLVDFLLAARDREPDPNYTPGLEQQRAIDRLLLTEEEAAALPLIDYPPPLPPFVPPEDEDDAEDGPDGV